MKTLCDFYLLGNNYGNCYRVKKSSFRERVWKLQAYWRYQCPYLISLFLSSSDCQTCDQRQNRLWLLLYCSWDVFYAHQCYTCQNIILPFQLLRIHQRRETLGDGLINWFIQKQDKAYVEADSLIIWSMPGRVSPFRLVVQLGYIKLAQNARFANPKRR